jgi:hypothetical protein
VQTFDKESIAVTQLERAIELYTVPRDFLSAITLAGAAEEILGKLVSDSGRDNSLASLVKAAVAIHELIFKEPIDQRVLADRANEARNSLKHLRTTSELTVSIDPEEEARDMINRAIENYWLLKSNLTEAMATFNRAHDAV